MEALTRCCRVPFDESLNEATPISSLRQGETAAPLLCRTGNSRCLSPVYSLGCRVNVQQRHDSPLSFEFWWSNVLLKGTSAALSQGG